MTSKTPKTLVPKSNALPNARVILDAIEEEQLGIAQELHDTVCQSLSGLRLSAAALRRNLGEVQGKALEEFLHLESVAAKVIGELHELVRGLQPVEIAPAELSFALEDLARELKPQIACDYRCVGRPAVADGFTASQVVRITRALAKLVVSAKNSRRLLIQWEQGVNDSCITFTGDQAAFGETETSPARLSSWNLIHRRAAAIGATITIEQSGAALVLRLPSAT